MLDDLFTEFLDPSGNLDLKRVVEVRDELPPKAQDLFWKIIRMREYEHMAPILNEKYANNIKMLTIINKRNQNMVEVFIDAAEKLDPAKFS